MIENNILGIILAGGKSSRFGEDKSTAKLGNKTLLDHTLNKIENEFNEILVISNNKEFNFKNNKIHVGAGAGVVADSIPENEWNECLQKAHVFLDAIEMIK